MILRTSDIYRLPFLSTLYHHVFGEDWWPILNGALILLETCSSYSAFFALLRHLCDVTSIQNPSDIFFYISFNPLKVVVPVVFQPFNILTKRKRQQQQQQQQKQQQTRRAIVKSNVHVLNLQQSLLATKFWFHVRTDISFCRYPQTTSCKWF